MGRVPLKSAMAVRMSGVAEGGHGLGVEVEEVAEGEGVVAGVLVEEGGEVGVGCGWGEWRTKNACGECCDGAEDEKDDGDALAGADEGVGYGEGFGFIGFVVEPCGDEEDERGDGGEDVVLLAGGEGEEEEWDGGPEAEEQAGAFAAR